MLFFYAIPSYAMTITMLCYRLATLEQKLIRQESLLKERLSDVVVDMQSQSKTMVEQGIDQWRAEVDGLVATRMSDYCKTTELDTRLLDLGRDRGRDGEVMDSLASQLMLLEERMCTQNGAMEDSVKAILARLDDDDVHDELRRRRRETGDDSRGMSMKGITMTTMKTMVDQSDNTIGGRSGGDSLEEEAEEGGGGGDLSRFHTMISNNSDIATIEEHLDESRSLDPQRLLPDDDDGDDDDDGEDEDDENPQPIAGTGRCVVCCNDIMQKSCSK